VQAAKYYNVPPWALQEQSIVWTYKALDYMSAEGEAQKTIADRKK